MYIQRLKVTIAEQAMQEYTAYQATVNAANTDYIAMMTDVELPNEDDTQEVNTDESEI